MECRAVCCQPGNVLSSEPPTPSGFATDFASLEQQALAAPKVKLLDQAEWYGGLTTHLNGKKLVPRVRQAMHLSNALLTRAEDVTPGELPLTLPGFSCKTKAGGTEVVQHDLLVRPTESGYQAMMVDVYADFPEAYLYCVEQLFGIWVQPKEPCPAALLPLYLVWWLNVHQAPCENPEALIQSYIPMPPLALQRELIALLA